MPDPPATQSQQPVNSGKACCPFAAQKPCDVDLLKVKVEFKDRPAPKGSGAITVRELETPIVKRKPVKTVWAGRTQVMVKNYPGLSESLNQKLAQYDFIIDCFADFPEPKVATATEWKAALKELVTSDGKQFAKEKAKISANAKFYGLHCERQEHGLLQMKPMSGKDKAPASMTSKKVDHATNEIVVHDFAAQRFPLLDNMFSPVSTDGEVEGGEEGAAGAMFIFEFIASIFGAMYPKEVEVIAYGCGKRAKEAPSPVNKDLRGLVRVFRKDVWTVGLRIPSLAEFKKEQSAQVKLATGVKEEKWSQDGRFGDQSSSNATTRTTRENGVVVTENKRENRDGDQGSSFKSTSTQYGAIAKKETESSYTDRDGSAMKGYTKDGAAYGGVPTRELVKKRMEEASSGFDLSINRNGVEVPFKATLKKIKAAVETFAKTLAQIQEMFQKAPQIGWKVTFSISALAGTIILEFGPKLMPAAADGRYLPINYVCEGSIKLELVNIKLGLSFGLDAQVLDSGLVLKVEGTVSLKIEISTDLNLDLITKPVKEIGLELKQTTEFKILAHVNVFGKTVAGAELSIAMGFEFKDGKLIIDVTKPTVDLKGVLRAQDVTVSGFIKVPWWWDKKVDKAKLLSGCDIYTFK